MLKTPNGLDKAAMKKVIEKLITTTQLISSACHELNYRRKDNLRKVLPAHMAPLCNYDKEVTSHLFGDDASKSVKDINETQRALSSSSFKGKAPRTKHFLGNGARNRGYTRPDYYQTTPQYHYQYQPQYKQPYQHANANFGPRGGASRGRGGPGRVFKRGKNRGGQ